MLSRKAYKKFRRLSIIALLVSTFVNNKLSQEYIFQQIIPFHPIMNQRLKLIEERIEQENYDCAERLIREIQSEYGIFPEIIGLSAHIDMICFLETDESIEQ